MTEKTPQNRPLAEPSRIATPPPRTQTGERTAEARKPAETPRGGWARRRERAVDLELEALFDNLPV